MSQVIHHHPSILIHAFRIGVESLKVYARGEKSCTDEGSPLHGGLGAHSPRKLLNLETQKYHLRSFLRDIVSKLIRRDIFVSSRPLNVGIHDLVTESQ